MKIIFIGGLMIVALGGCQHSRLEPRSGTELTTDGNGKETMTTFVSEAEYERMSPEERALVHAAVGIKATQTLWGRAEAAPSNPLGSDELNKALAADAAQRASGQR